ncbi:MAG: amidohydrolase family protein [Planctomycetaceae bacterium]
MERDREQERHTPATRAAPRVDCHTHIFCWGENPEEGFLSEKTRRAWLTRLVLFLTGIRRESGATLSEKIRSRLQRQLQASQLDSAVVLAQDAVYREDGVRDDANTHFYVSNDYVLRLAGESEKIIPGCSINPLRPDALQELERCYSAGARLIKVHTAIQGVDPSRAEFEPFYRLAEQLGVTLMFHTGYEHSCTVISQEFSDPRRLRRALDYGVTVIAAHCGTCAFYDREDYYPGFIEMMNRYDNLYGDTAVLAGTVRWNALKRLSGEPESVRRRILHGSDYPLPPGRLPYLTRTGLFPAERRNPLDLDWRIKSSFAYGPRYGDRILDLLGISSQDARQTEDSETEPALS